ncbi:MAG: zinc metalloprotease HtpX [Bacillota bacterium]|nr:zinc metalloprotease HtpX [Bacillota bacterium]
MNRLKTLALLSMLTALLLWVGQSLAGQGGLLVALVIAVAMNFGAYWFSDRFVLRMHRARELGAGDATELFSVVQGLANSAGLPRPKLYLIPDDSPNAFATGRNPRHAAVAVTEGLVRLLNRQEIAAVVAHELGHIKNRDTLIMTAAATIAGALSMLGNMVLWSTMLGGGASAEDDAERSHPLAGLLGVLLAPIAASLIQLAISRSREFLADEAGARITGNPLALASALRKIEILSQRVPMVSGSPATAHLCIVNPFSGGGLVRLFSTHPPTAARVERLEAMAVRGYPVAV